MRRNTIRFTLFLLCLVGTTAVSALGDDSQPGPAGPVEAALRFISAFSGDQIAVMAADLQEPPELITSFFDLLSTGKADVVFGQRMGRDDPPLRRLGSNLFWSGYRRFVLPEMPKGGVDIFACNRQAVILFSHPIIIIFFRHCSFYKCRRVSIYI